MKNSINQIYESAVNINHPCGPYRVVDIERAKKNIRRYLWARNYLASLKINAQWWMDLPEDQISLWVPDLTPIRILDCPKCGASGQTDYVWKHLVDARIQCTFCQTIYPNSSYPETGSEILITPHGHKVEYAFYQDSKEKKYYISGRVRYARILRLNEIGALGKYYALTGNTAYAEKAVKILRRLAQVYPGYVPHDWNRFYGDYSNQQSGKLSGWKIHDALTFLQLATCYDLVYNSGCLTEHDKVLIENNAFREAVRLFTATSPKGQCVNDGPYAMSAVALLGVILGDHNAIKWAISPPDGFLGFIHQHFYRDGHWGEGTIHYGNMAIGLLYACPEILQGYSDPPDYKGEDRYDNINLLKDHVLRHIYTASFYTLMPDRTNPPINDSCKEGEEAVYSRQQLAQHAEINYFWYPTERNKRILAYAYNGKRNNEEEDKDALSRRPPDERSIYHQHPSEYALFRRPPDINLSKVKPLDLAAKSIVCPGPGWAILRTNSGPKAAALYLNYGCPRRSGHSHFDKLNIIYYDNSTELVTDLGYLGAGHANASWIRSTLAHNVALIDGQSQKKTAGELLLFSPGKVIQTVSAMAPSVYETAKRYERTVALVDHGPGKRYVVDVFRLAGGQQHDYAVHGAGTTFIRPNGEWGTFSGPVVAGETSGGDNRVTSAEQTKSDGNLAAEWREGTDGVRIDLLGQAGTMAFHLIAPGLRNRSTPWDSRDLHILMVRRLGPSNTFVSVIHPIQGKNPLFEVSAVSAKVEKGKVAAVAVRSSDFEDIIVIGDAESAQSLTICDCGLNFHGEQAFYSQSGSERIACLINGSKLTFNDLTIISQPRVEGKVLAIDQKRYTITVNTDLFPVGETTKGQFLLFKDLTDGVYEIDSIRRGKDRVSIIKLANKPIINFNVDQSFIFVTRSLVTLRSNGLTKRESNIIWGQPLK